MTRIHLALLLTLFTFSAQSQLKIESRIGGSNFLGATINGGADVHLNSEASLMLESSIGIGVLYPQFEANCYPINFTNTLRYKRLGAGLEMSYFLYPRKSPVYGSQFIDYLLYPNVSYRQPLGKHWYCGASVGAYFAFSNSGVEQSKTINFEGDVIPGGGLYVGYRFKHLTKKQA